MPRFVYFYLMSNKPDAIRSVASRHAAYWHEQRLPGYQGGPFEDRSGGLILFSAADESTAATLVAHDPFLKENLLADHWLKVWAPDLAPE